MTTRYWFFIITSAAITAFIAWFGLWTIHQMENNNRSLVDNDLPLVIHIQLLSSLLSKQEIVFYQYYLTGESPSFKRDIKEELSAIDATLSLIEKKMGVSQPLLDLKTSAIHIQEISVTFDSAMSSPTDWDGARAVLAEFIPIAKNINKNSRSLVKMTNKMIALKAQQGLTVTKNGVFWVSAMGLAILFAAAALLWLNNRLRHLAYHDPLTGLCNRSHFISQLKQSHNFHFLAILDIDGFQKVITSSGHTTADKIMQACVARILESLSAYKSSIGIFRFEGSRFCILFEHQEMASTILNSIHNSIALPISANNREFFASYSIGCVSFTPEEEINIDELLRKADSALHNVKVSGGNGIRTYDESLDKDYLRQRKIETALRHALEKGEFTLHLQPQYALEGNKLIGAESLLRWHHNQSEWISPAEFIPIAESTGFMVPLGEWVVRESCRIAAQWKNLKGAPFVVAINISAQQWEHDSLPTLIKSTLSEFNLKPENIELEITESAALNDFEKTIKVMKELREAGIRLAIDDFGTGYSSLSYLNKLPAHKLKIDRSFVVNMVKSTSDASITQTIITLAHSLGLLVIAEGVETLEQLETLKTWGCDEIQGYLLGKPMPSEELFKLPATFEQPK